MRRCVLVFACVLMASCGLELAGTLGPVDGPDGGPIADGSVPTNHSEPSFEDSSTGDASIDAPVEDAFAPVVPSHVDASIDLGAADLTGATTINTTNRTVMIGATPAVVKFEAIGDVTVLFVGAWNVNANVRVSGTKPLVVIASKAVTITANIDASAVKEAAGPGGFGSALGPGKGNNGAEGSGSDSTGAGGAGFGSPGAKGANTNSGDQGAAGGGVYGASIAAFFGGSGGGTGSPFGLCNQTSGLGGAGGGALQITSAVSISIAAGTAVGAGGGGGRGGCENGSNGTMSGGGGGSGGTIFLEAPAITIDGAVASNGGGGGGAASNGNGSGGDGNNGGLTRAVASGGSGPLTELRGGNGGAGTTLPSIVQTGTSNGAGGGGAVGRIWLRTRGPQLVLGAQHIVSPDAGVDTTL